MAPDYLLGDCHTHLDKYPPAEIPEMTMIALGLLKSHKVAASFNPIHVPTRTINRRNVNASTRWHDKRGIGQRRIAWICSTSNSKGVCMAA